MKKLLSVILAVVMVATMFVGISVQPVSAEDTATQTAETTDAVYRYESIFDFSQDIPETTATANKDYTVDRVKDGENWAFKITQADSQWSNDYIRFRVTDMIEIPDDALGMRMIYRSANSMSGNIGLFYDGAWYGRISKYDSANYSAAGTSFDETLMFADAEKDVTLRSNYYFEFELHASDANSEVELYVYDIQFVYESDAVDIGDSTDSNYRYESIFDFSQGIPQTTTLNSNKTYTTAQVQDNGKWAMKITQSTSEYTGDYVKFELSDSITIPTGKGLAFNEKLIGMRMVYRLGNSAGGNIGFIINGAWTFNFLDPNNYDSNNKVFFDAGTYDKTLKFADYSNVALGSSYKLIFEPRSSATGTPFEIYIYDIQFVYEVDATEYRYSTVYDFENMTDAQAKKLFVDEKNGTWATATVTAPEVEDGQDKYVQIMANEAYSDYGRNAIRYKLSGFNIPNDKHCVGIRIKYEGINLRAGKIAFIQSYNWTDTNMLAESSTDIGERDVVAFFKDDTKLNISSSSSVDLVFYLRTASTSDTTLLPGIKIYKIEFLYDDVFDGTTETVRDYEGETEGVIYENYQGTPTDDSEDITHNTGDSGTTEFAYISGAGQNASMGLKRTTDSSVSWHNDSILKISKETMADPALIGMRLWVSLKNNGTPRIQVRYNGTWTTLQFNASGNELSVGAHDIVVMFKDGLIEVNTDSTTTDFSTARYSASTDFYLALDEGGANEIVFDNIEFIYANPTTAEFIDATGISGTNSVHTTEGRVGAEIQFPANLASVNEYEYFFSGWAQETGKDSTVASGTTHTLDDVKYYAVWTPGVSELRKVVLGNTTSAWVESNVNEDDVVDIRDLVYQNEYTEELKFQAALAEMNMSGTAFLKSFGTQEAAAMNGFDATANTEVATSKDLAVGDYIQLNFEDYTSINTFTVNETTANVRDFRIMAWNGEEWVRVYRNDLIEGTHECVLEQNVCTLAIRLYIDGLKDGSTTATIASVTANGRQKIERTEKFGLTAFIGDSVYKHNWETIDSDMLMSYDDVILINNWHFDEAGNLAVSVSTDEGLTRTLYSSTSDEGKAWTKTFLDNYDGLFDGDVKNEDKPKIWLSLTALKKEGNWDDTLNNFSPMNQAWYEGITGTYQPGESNAYGEKTVRTALINNITNYISYIEDTLGYEVYGIDIDWEYPYGDEQQEDYYNLLKELGAELHNNGKKLSIDQLVDWCTLPYSYYNDSAIDRINIMTYSHNETGTDYQHSTYLDACVNAIKGYADAGVDLSKIYLGVPFYGVEMAKEDAASTDWHKISVGAFDRGVNNYTIDGVEYNFNGPNVLQDKVLYSLQQKLGGMMVWWIKNDYTEREAKEAGVEYNKDLTLTYYLRDAVDRFSYVDDQE